MSSDSVSTDVQPSVHDEDSGGKDFQIIITPSKRKTVKKVFVSISGNFTVKNIREIKAQIEEAIAPFDHLTVKLKSIAHIDLSAVQLLHLLSLQDKEFNIDQDLSADHRQVLSIAGFSDLISQSLTLSK